jgi:hypothetical protein
MHGRYRGCPVGKVRGMEAGQFVSVGGEMDDWVEQTLNVMSCISRGVRVDMACRPIAVTCLKVLRCMG